MFGPFDPNFVRELWVDPVESLRGSSSQLLGALQSKRGGAMLGNRPNSVIVEIARDLRICTEIAQSPALVSRSEPTVACQPKRLPSAEQIEKGCALPQLGIDVLFLHDITDELEVRCVDKEENGSAFFAHCLGVIQRLDKWSLLVRDMTPECTPVAPGRGKHCSAFQRATCTGKMPAWLEGSRQRTY
mgnify:CR=1 FL=1